MFKSKLVCIGAVASCIFCLPAIANQISFTNNSDYDIRVWGQICEIKPGLPALCDSEGYQGVILAHQSNQILESISENKFKDTSAEIGLHVTHAIIDQRLQGLDPKAKIAEFPSCNAISNQNQNLIFDVNTKTNEITCGVNPV